MSGSDSDLDYQSADDDTDFDTNLKPSTEEQQLDSKELSTSDETKLAKNSTHGRTSQHSDTEEPSKNVKISELNINVESANLEENEKLSCDLSEETCEVSSSNVSSKIADDKSSEENFCKDERGEKKNILEESKSRDECKDRSCRDLESNKPSDILPKKADLGKSVNKEIPDVFEEESQKSSLEDDEREPPKENQRVVLRLEKLINQKQQKFKDVSPLKEKASDLVNMLQEPPKVQQSSWGFSSWGTSLLSSAASSVSTFSSQVSQGIGTVLDTVESTLGAPGPEELAKALNEKKKEQGNQSANIDDPTEKEDRPSKDDQTDSKLGLLPDVSFFTNIIENTGSKVIMGGLDTLEFIGKKTMNILTEGDPGLRSKRSLFGDGVNLSEILREAKTRAEQEQEDNPDDKDNIHYGQVFDEKQGLVHLEALEILSKQSQVKFQRLLMRHSKKIEVKKKLEEIKSICENLPSFDDPSESEQFDDFETVFKKHSIELSIPLNVDGIIKTQRQIHDNICKFESSSDDSKSTPKEIFKSAISSIAEFTAKSIETFHKIAELILVQPNISKDIEQYATNLTGLTTVMCIEINNLSSRYHKCLDSSNVREHLEGDASSDSVDTTALATNLYVEAANSNNYIQDAYQMIVPILQVWVLEALDDN